MQRDPLIIKAELLRANKLLKAWRESQDVNRGTKITFYYNRREELLEELHPTKQTANR